MSWNWEKDNLISDMREFLTGHTVSELLNLVRIVVEEKEEQDEHLH